MPSARQVFVPTPLMNTPPAVLRQYVEGDDPVHSRPFMAEVFDQLTRPVPAGELRGEDWDRSTPRYVEASSKAVMHRDPPGTPLHGLPAGRPADRGARGADAGGDEPPTPRDGGQAPPHDRHGALALRRREGRGERSHGRSRAGALPGDPRARLERRHRAPEQLSSMGNMVVVNGPIRHEIGMNSGIGAMGPYNHANSVIGRAFGLLSQNLQGGSVPGITYAGSQGCNFSYNCITFAENEEASPWSRITCSTATAGTRARSRWRTSGAASGPNTCARTGRRSCRR